eukprot:2586672-Pyramimonas_sp.AAC.1
MAPKSAVRFSPQRPGRGRPRVPGCPRPPRGQSRDGLQEVRMAAGLLHEGFQSLKLNAELGAQILDELLEQPSMQGLPPSA